MPKEFYTEKDIEDLVKRGVMSLTLNDNVVLTEVAYEKANRLGLKLLRERPENPPSAPVRPYISAGKPSFQGKPTLLPVDSAAALGKTDDKDLQQRIRSAVQARLGSQVDSALLDVIIQRVLASTGVK